MQICVVGTEERRDNLIEDEDSLAASFIVRFTGVAQGFLDVLEAVVFPGKRQILRYRAPDWDSGDPNRPPTVCCSGSR
jgi:hypothetical protein